MMSYKSLIKISVLISILIPSVSFSAPLFIPGQTLNPGCLPSNPDCTVSTTTVFFIDPITLSFAHGSTTIASGYYSHSEGQNTLAAGTSSHAEGANTQALDWFAHATGLNTIAAGYSSNASGIGSVASGTASFAGGQGTDALGYASYAVGIDSVASGNAALASGQNTLASGNFSFSSGIGTQATGQASYAAGTNSIASGDHSFATGINTIASAFASYAAGMYSVASGTAAFAIGQNTVASGYASFSSGQFTLASGAGSHAEGQNTQATGGRAHAEGLFTTASGNNSHAEGNGTQATGDQSHAQGNYTTASGFAAFSAGTGSVASGDHSFAGGLNTQALGYASYAVGINSITSGTASFAWGQNTQATNYFSYAGGLDSVASGHTSFAQGNNAHALHANSTVFSDSNGATSTAINQMTLSFANGVLLNPSAGNVLIGTTTDDGIHRLQVDGSVMISAGNSYDLNGRKLAYGNNNLNNYFFGAAGNSTMTGINNVASGYTSFLSNTTGSYNTASGLESLYSNNTGTRNSAYGSDSLFFNTSGSNNTAIGTESLESNISGLNNTANGVNALTYNTVGSNNTAIGVNALISNVSGDNNIGLGYFAGGYELGSNALYIDNIDRGNSTNSKTQSLIYGISSTTLSAQTLTFNANVGIGTTTPDSKLTISGDIHIATSSGSLRISDGNDTRLTRTLLGDQMNLYNQISVVSTPVFYENFTQYSIGTSLDSNPPFFTLNGNTSFTVQYFNGDPAQGKSAYTSATGAINSAALYNQTVFSGDQAIQATVSANQAAGGGTGYIGGHLGLDVGSFAISGIEDTGYACDIRAVDGITIYRMDSGSPYYLLGNNSAYINFTPNSNFIMKFERVGNTFNCYINGTLAVSGTDSTYSSGYQEVGGDFDSATYYKDIVGGYTASPVTTQEIALITSQNSGVAGEAGINTFGAADGATHLNGNTLYFDINGINKALVSANGNVGIGVNSPNAKLTVYATPASSDDVFQIASSSGANYFKVASDGSLTSNISASGNFVFNTDDGAGNTSVLFDNGTDHHFGGDAYLDLNEGGGGNYTGTLTGVGRLYLISQTDSIDMQGTLGRTFNSNGPNTISEQLTVNNIYFTIADAADSGAGATLNFNKNQAVGGFNSADSSSGGFNINNSQAYLNFYRGSDGAYGNMAVYSGQFATNFNDNAGNSGSMYVQSSGLTVNGTQGLGSVSQQVNTSNFYTSASDGTGNSFITNFNPTQLYGQFNSSDTSNGQLIINNNESYSSFFNGSTGAAGSLFVYTTEFGSQFSDGGGNSGSMYVENSGTVINTLNTGLGSTQGYIQPNLIEFLGQDTVSFHIGFGQNQSNFFIQDASSTSNFFIDPNTVPGNTSLSSAGSILLQPVSGNVGIGTINAATKLTILGNSGTTDTTIQIVGNGISTLFLGQDSDGGVLRGQGGNNALKFIVGGSADTAASAGGTEAMRIISNGNVGIGTSTPDATLTISGTPTTTLLRLAGFGSGSLSTDAAGNVINTSDEHLKDIQGNYTKGLAEIEQLTPINYTWKTETGLDTSTTYSGFSAQNVQSVIPEAIGKNGAGFLTLNDRPIIAALVNAVKQIGSFIAKIENGITYLKNIAIGTNEKPEGITMFDRKTGQPYCVIIDNGILIDEPGACGTQSAINNTATVGNSITTTIATSTISTDTSTSTATSTDEIVSDISSSTVDMSTSTLVTDASSTDTSIPFIPVTDVSSTTTTP